MSKQEVVKTRLSKGEKEDWKRFCQANSVSESDMLRIMIQRVCGEAVPIDTADSLDLKSEKKTGKVTIRLTEVVYRKLNERAKQEGYTNRTNWVTSKVLAELHREAVLTDDEVAALRESNRELAAIGRNLNQVARTLNIEFRESDKIKREAIEQLAERIEQHKELIFVLLNKNMNRWE